MKLTGSYQINLEKQKVWEALNDPEILKKTIPGCQEFKKNSETEFTATATNKIGPFNASFTGDIELTDLDPPNSYKIIGSGNSLVGFATGEASVKLEDSNEGTKLTYVVEANVGGKITKHGTRYQKSQEITERTGSKAKIKGNREKVNNELVWKQTPERRQRRSSGKTETGYFTRNPKGFGFVAIGGGHPDVFIGEH